MSTSEVLADSVEVNLFDRQTNRTHMITIDLVDTTKLDLLAEILEGSQIDIEEFNR